MISVAISMEYVHRESITLSFIRPARKIMHICSAVKLLFAPFTLVFCILKGVWREGGGGQFRTCREDTLRSFVYNMPYLQAKRNC